MRFYYFWSLNFFKWYSRKEYSRKINRIWGTLPVGWNDKGIPRNTSTKVSYRNPQRNDPIDQDAQCK
jgi:hypothetical protein